MIYSKYQKAIFEEIENGTGHIVIEAVAGSGKTFSVVQAAKLVHGDVGFVAFNKHIATELAEKLPECDVRTLHSLGMRAVTLAYGSVQVDTSKIYKLLKPKLERFEWKEANQMSNAAQKIIGLLKGNLLEPSPKNIRDLMFYHGIECPREWKFFSELIAQTLMTANFNTKKISFDDMVCMPVEDDLPCHKYDVLFVDEAQDLNPAQLELILKSIKPDGRIIAVGDRKQSIYGFRGADADSIPKIIERLNAKVLPLSITYRCPTKVVDIAKRIVPDIQAAPEAIEGEVKTIEEWQLLDEITTGDLALCRYNAPLVAPAFHLIKNGIKAIIKGKDIGKNLIKIIKDLKARDIENLEYKLKQWTLTEVNKAEKRNQNPQMIIDKTNCIYSFLDGDIKSIEELIRHIESIFSDGKGEVTFSSIHKAKGLEADNVFIIQPELMPCRYATQEWEKVQEENIWYVAVTRAKKKLIYVMGDNR